MWRHTECNGVSNYRRLDGLSNSLLRPVPLQWEFTGDQWIPCTKRASKAENVFIWWRNYGTDNVYWKCKLRRIVRSVKLMKVVFVVSALGSGLLRSNTRGEITVINVCINTHAPYDMLTHCGRDDLWKWAIFNTILTSPKSWLSQEDLETGCEYSLVPMDS